MGEVSFLVMLYNSVLHFSPLQMRKLRVLSYNSAVFFFSLFPMLINQSDLSQKKKIQISLLAIKLQSEAGLKEEISEKLLQVTCFSSIPNSILGSS